MEKETIAWIGILSMMIVLLFIGNLIQFVGVPTTNYGGDTNRECIKWSKPKPSSDGYGSWRQCLKTISIDDLDFQGACYWNYDCDFKSSWRNSLMGVPRDCIRINQSFSYWYS